MLAVLLLVASAPVCGQDNAELRANEPPANAIWLDSLDLTKMEQQYGEPRAGKSVDGNFLTLNGIVYPHGIGTHSYSRLLIDLKGEAVRFVSMVGVDDEVTKLGSVAFAVYLDDKKVAGTGQIRFDTAPKLLSVDVTGAKRMALVVDNGGDIIEGDHADWAGAMLIMSPGAKSRPEAVRPEVEPAPPIASGAPAEPAIHGPQVVGATPGRPFLFLIPATGTGPLTYSAKGLPDGLTLDKNTGIISGSLAQSGTFTIDLGVQGPKGSAFRKLTVVSGEHKLAQTPPMGWNSWNAWGLNVDEDKIRRAADFLVESGLAAHGYQYVNIDDSWAGKRDAEGNIQSNSKFPDMKALGDYIHSKGLKFGIYSSPGPRTCCDHEGSLGHEAQDAITYAKWGVDYLKYDWCSYGAVAKDGSLPELQKPYRIMGEALDKCGRDIVYSLCQYGMGNSWEWAPALGGNLWRTTSDITDTWDRLSGIGFSQNSLEKYAGPGHWNDPDMLVVGRLGWGTGIHASSLTPNEQITHITLWSLLAAPLLLGCDLSQLDRFTLDLLTNDEVIDVDQDPLGQAAGRRAQAGGTEVWARPLCDGIMAVGLFNLNSQRIEVTAKWEDLGLTGLQPVRDLWKQKDIGLFTGSFSASIPAHGAVMVKVGRPNPQLDAKWVWAGTDNAQPFQFARFRKTFSLDKPVSKATASIAADTFYRLWINGRLAMHGPARSSAGKATLDVVEIADFLHVGKNSVLAEVLYQGIPVYDTLSQAAGLLCQIDVESAGENRVIGTDSTWEACDVAAYNRKSPRFSFQRGWVEDYDGRAVDAWKPAVILGEAGIGPWRTIELRDVPLPAALEPVRPAKVVGTQKGDGTTLDVGQFWWEPQLNDGPPEWIRRLETENVEPDDAAVYNPAGPTTTGKTAAVLRKDGAGVTYDFGANYVGFVGFEVTGKAGDSLEFAFDERLSGRGNTVRPRERLMCNLAFRYTLRDGRQSFLAFNPQLMRYLRVVLRGQGEVTIHRLYLTEFRFDALAKGDFRCSDDELNRIYKAARRTSMLCTLDSFMDCPSRERGGWFHDSYWAARGAFALFGDTSVNRRMVRQGAESQGRLDPPGMVQMCVPTDPRNAHTTSGDTFIPGHALFWVLQVGLDERLTGKIDCARALLPAVGRLLTAFETWRSDEGLLENVPSWNWLDWSDLRYDGVSVAQNALYAKVLDEAARLERLCGCSGTAEHYEQAAKQVRDALNRYCGAGPFYPDTLSRDKDGKLIPDAHKNETTQYYAMWCNVASKERTKQIWDVLRKTGPHDGLAAGGLYRICEQLHVAARLGDYETLIRDVKSVFLPMADSDPGTLWEFFSPSASLCHGFCSEVAAVLTEELLGIEWGHPVKIAPHGGGALRWCKGYITTPPGRIGVQWKLGDRRYELTVSLPKGLTAEVVLPEEARSVWQSEHAESQWTENCQVSGRSSVIVEPGRVRITGRAKGR